MPVKFTQTEKNPYRVTHEGPVNHTSFHTVRRWRQQGTVISICKSNLTGNCYMSDICGNTLDDSELKDATNWSQTYAVIHEMDGWNVKEKQKGGSEKEREGEKEEEKDINQSKEVSPRQHRATPLCHPWQRTAIRGSMERSHGQTKATQQKDTQPGQQQKEKL